jgi:hypothetical protein
MESAPSPSAYINGQGKKKNSKAEELARQKARLQALEAKSR